MNRCFIVLSLIWSAAVNAQTMSVSMPVASAPAEWPVRGGAFDIADFRFHDGEILHNLHLHYLTLGTLHRGGRGHPDNAILLLHGTGGSARSLLAPQFSNALFGPGQPFDINKYFLIFPDDIGHGLSSKPSDGPHMHFPAYDYDDMVAAQHSMLVDGLHVDHLRLILGTSMGCMQTFLWGETFAGFSDALAPFACLPVQIAGRNRMMRYMAIDAVKRDPAWKNGEYTAEPILGLRTANEMLLIMGSAPLQMQKEFPTRVAAEQHVEAFLERTVAHTDANDLIYFMDASRNYDPAPKLSTITAPVLWINSADDFINPPELGIAPRMVSLMPHSTFILLPISDATQGHGTHSVAAVWKNHLVDFLAQTEKR